jgi:hypothetical protein
MGLLSAAADAVGLSFDDAKKDLLSDKVAGKILRYPLGIGDNKSPVIVFHIHKAQYSLRGVSTTVGSHIALHMVKGFQAGDSLNYTDRQSGIAGSVMMNGLPSSEEAKNSIKAMLGEESFKEVTSLAGTAAGGMIGGGSGAVIGNIVSQSLGNMAVEQLKNTQQVFTENPFITFQGVNLRSWAFPWTFHPSSKEESQAVKQIIQRFREAMYPARTNNGLTLQFPMVFNIEILNANLPKMPEVALVSLNVTYNGTSNSYFLDTDEPTEVALNLEFKELMPIYKNHVKEGY